MDLQALIGGFGAEVLQITVLEILQRVEVSDEERIRLEFDGVIDELRRLPTQRAHRKVVETQFDVPARCALRERADAERRGGPGGRNRLQEGAAIGGNRR